MDGHWPLMTHRPRTQNDVWTENCECIYDDLRMLIACVHDWSMMIFMNIEYKDFWCGNVYVHRVKNIVPHTLDSEGNSWSKSLFLLMCSFLWLPCNHLCHFFYCWSHHFNNARDTQNIKTSPTCSSIELNCWDKLAYFCCQMPCSFVRIRPETSDCKIICDIL